MCSEVYYSKRKNQMIQILRLHNKMGCSGENQRLTINNEWYILNPWILYSP